MLRSVKRLVLRRLVCNLKINLFFGLLVFLIVYYVNVYSFNVPLTVGVSPRTTPGNRLVWDGRRSENISAGKCYVKCPENQFSFYIRSGSGRNLGPTICFNNKEYISPQLKNFHRGLNVVFINAKTKKVTSTTNFDTYIENSGLIRYLKRNISDQSVALIASFDEITRNLNEDGVKWIELFGSYLIKKIDFRDSFVLIGQIGLKQGHAIEFHQRKDKNGFGKLIEKSGCFPIPMGVLQEVKQKSKEILMGTMINFGSKMKNCGMKDRCADDTIPVWVFTGKENTEYPQICVNGNLILGKNLNRGGRGINAVAVDVNTKLPVKIATFDVYEEDSSDLEIFLESLKPTEFLVSCIWDDASKKFSFHAKELLNLLGSSMIHNLKFRDVWYFVGQQGIKGFAKWEQISYAPPGNRWPKPLEMAACIPKKIEGFKIKPDPQVYRNDQRRAFCQAHEGYMEFCDTSHVDDLIQPAGLVDNAYKGHEIFETPIFIILGVDHNAAVNTLQTVIMQSGINPKMVVVCWDEKFPEFAQLAELFGFQNKSLASSTRYADVMKKSIEAAWQMFPLKDHIIFIEEELLLSPDFLFFMAQCMLVLEIDPTLFAASAWSYNGYETTSENRSMVYRVQDFPSLAFMLKRSIYNKFMKGQLDTCCSKRVWEGWTFSSAGEIIVPDVSRVYRQPYLSASSSERFMKILFHVPRLTNLEQKALLVGVEKMRKDFYEMHLNSLLQNSIPLDVSFIRILLRNSMEAVFPHSKPRSYSLYYVQNDNQDFSLLKLISKWFGLQMDPDHTPKGLHNGMLRFIQKGNQMFFIGSLSPYIKYKPQQYKLITSNLLQQL